ncbi:hypothetical protein M094_4240 [Bacteroides uniformis str. 3978 T3 ii]|uniref:Uncharacterized protein n=1 Tax=Bacteroides uniformis str. 3978 T3 ii TaxID=1339349 RepID=A0A078RZP9_BACUN|nr:hypothetical protein M094_1739 [Bacteroides uniformis str. 3978 T3 ii]KDS55075.1 hypothetical protein M094_4240 [Bacteroides uniformis str. 3978 T3 ii]
MFGSNASSACPEYIICLMQTHHPFYREWMMRFLYVLFFKRNTSVYH